MNRLKPKWQNKGSVIFETRTLLLTPTRSPDLEFMNYRLWFHERVMSIRNSNLKWESPVLLAECPESTLLMYMDGFHPQGWKILTDQVVQEAYTNYVLEKAFGLEAQDT